MSYCVCARLSFFFCEMETMVIQTSCCRCGDPVVTAVKLVRSVAALYVSLQGHSQQI